MERRHSNYKGWKLCTVPGRPCLGHGVRATRLHAVILAKGPTEANVLDELHRQVDAKDVAGEAPAQGPNSRKPERSN
jgi:hypothetical protein